MLWPRQTFTSETLDDGKALSNTGSFKLSDPSGMDVKYEYTKSADYKYSFESNFNLSKLADISGVKVVLSGDNNQTVKGKVEYAHSMAAVSVTGGVQGGAVKFPFSVGMSPMAGVDVGISGTVLPKPAPEQLYENVSFGYTQKGSFGVFLGLTKNLSKLEARGIYYGLPDTVVAVKATGLMEGKPSFIGGGEYKLDKVLPTHCAGLRFALPSHGSNVTVCADYCWRVCDVGHQGEGGRHAKWRHQGWHEKVVAQGLRPDCRL